MKTAKEHYEEFLAEIYPWMMGPEEEGLAAARAWIERLAPPQRPGAVALDLGCGHGLQTFALADLGYRVIAIDQSQTLLDLLEKRKGARPEPCLVTSVCADLRNFKSLVEGPVDLVVIMGDTLTHLDDLDQITNLLIDARAVLHPKGRILVQFRDLSKELKGSDRFLLVKGDPTRVLTTFLEFDPTHVKVNDAYLELQGETWTTRKSSYKKTRVSLEWVAATCRKVGFCIEFAEHGGQAVLSAMYDDSED